MEDWERILREELAETDVIDIHTDKDPLLAPPTPRNAAYWQDLGGEPHKEAASPPPAPTKWAQWREWSTTRAHPAAMTRGQAVLASIILTASLALALYGPHQQPAAQETTGYSNCYSPPPGTALFDLVDPPAEITDAATPPHFTKYDAEYCDPETMVRALLATQSRENVDVDLLHALGNRSALPIM